MHKKNTSITATALICFGLIALMLLVYYQAVFGEKPPESRYEISVVLYDAGNDGWESLMEGMKQAGEDLAVNINYVIAEEGADAAEQIAMIREEIENGTGGILLASADSSIMCQEAQIGDVPVPIITLESGTDDQAYPFISANNISMGNMLAEAILEDFSDREEINLVVVEEYKTRDSVRQRRQGLYEVLNKDERVRVTVLERKLEYEGLQRFLSKALEGSKVDAIVSLSKETLHALCEADVEILQGKKLYGIGNTDSIVAALDDGKIENLVFQNEFNMGYLGVENLLKEMEGIRSADIDEIDSYCVSRQDIFEMQYERLLFPIVE